MYDKDTNQKTRAPRRGEPITASDMNKIVALILQTVKGGRGVLVKRVGQSIIIEAEQGRAVGGRVAGASDVFVYATTFAGLATPTVVNKFARVTDGADKGMTCVVNADANGWVPFTHFG